MAIAKEFEQAYQSVTVLSLLYFAYLPALYRHLAFLASFINSARRCTLPDNRVRSLCYIRYIALPPWQPEMNHLEEYFA
jgi:hypothetical protein